MADTATEEKVIICYPGHLRPENLTAIASIPLLEFRNVEYVVLPASPPSSVWQWLSYHNKPPSLADLLNVSRNNSNLKVLSSDEGSVSFYCVGSVDADVALTGPKANASFAVDQDIGFADPIASHNVDLYASNVSVGTIELSSASVGGVGLVELIASKAEKDKATRSLGRVDFAGSEIGAAVHDPPSSLWCSWAHIPGNPQVHKGIKFKNEVKFCCI